MKTENSRKNQLPVCGAKAIGWVMMMFSFLMLLGSLVIAIWDGFKGGFTFWQFFIRLVIMFTVYKVYDMIFFDYFLLMKFHFFQHYYLEIESAFEGTNTVLISRVNC